MKNVTILGAGVMGSAMALPFSTAGYQINLVGTHMDEATITSVQKNGIHPKLGIKLPTQVKAFHHTGLRDAIGRDANLILLGVASSGITWALEKLNAVLTRPVPILMITKGLVAEGEDLIALPDVVQRSLEKKFSTGVLVAGIAGPCIAGELAARRQTGTTIISRDLNFARQLCRDLETEYYHPRPSDDMIGAEICAAFKNFFAIAVGFAHGSLAQMAPTENNALNNNAASMVFNQSIRELMILTTAFGGSAESVWGMPGAGDLYVTCMAGRNSRLGHQLGKGLTYSQVKAGPMKDDTIEGAELGLSVAGAVRAMMKSGKLPETKLPLTVALLDALTHDQPLALAWRDFHHSE